MKNRFSILLTCFLLLALISCKKQETMDYYEGGTAPTLTESTSTVTLEPGQESKTAIVFNWTNPEYKFTSGPSSQNVTYSLEIDTMGANFGSSKKYTEVISPDLSRSYTVAALNDILGNTMLLQLNPRRNYTLQARVISSIAGNVKIASNPVSFTTKPFAPPPKVTPPGTAPNYTDGKLFLVGDATPGGWANPVPVPSQQFTQVAGSNGTKYQLTVPLTGGLHFLFLPVNGDWGNKYAVHDGGTQPKDGGDFGYNGGNSYYNADIPGPDASGTYKITVDFQLGKYTVVKQ
ncbi:MAG: SusE domain-containing protein [Flavisolibacter sp.]